MIKLLPALLLVSLSSIATAETYGCNNMDILKYDSKIMLSMSKDKTLNSFVQGQLLSESERLTTEYRLLNLVCKSDIEPEYEDNMVMNITTDNNKTY